MLQSLLEDRFHLKLRSETKEVPVYVLVVGKAGPKFRENKSDSIGNAIIARGTAGQILLQNASMGDFVSSLSKFVDRILVDTTGLTGKYDFDVTNFLNLRSPDA